MNLNSVQPINLYYSLSSDLASRVLAYLGVERSTPDLALLDTLVAAYTRTVPWESASRIVRRARVANTADCPRWPEEFWQMAMRHGTGGTCFESNYAFFSLLRALGYDGYLTINDMGQTIGCHTAIVVALAAERWLVDAGFPVHTPLPLHSDKLSERACSLLSYSARPLWMDHYQIERAPHPKPVCFTLVNTPVAEADYRAATTADYRHEMGLFLHEVIVNKVLGDRIWRFTNREKPSQMEYFENGCRVEVPIEGDVVEAVARRFGIDAEIIGEAMARVPDL